MTATPMRAGVDALLTRYERLTNGEPIYITAQTLNVDGGSVMA